uniref:Neuronal acetylcholine receptor subunit alpha-9-I-like n=1 Tax=Saccoglossus kowalevskii TaxID=10224 RepID=A0ABM0M3J1_SACKO|nr:PREDICTED: neuronal acetylcholine receptor subunit alpha-9-I-like [Saccoglossus kowalevskii]
MFTTQSLNGTGPNIPETKGEDPLTENNATQSVHNLWNGKFEANSDGLDAGVMLVEYLLTRYPPHPVRPVRNQSTTLQVTHRMTPIQLIDMQWVDEYLTWDPNDFNGINEIQLPIESLWQPDTVIYSSVSHDSLRHLDTEAIVQSNGSIMAIQFFIIQATCAIDATLFPFDEQRCNFRFASWSYHGNLMNYIPDPASNIKRFIPNGEWELLEMPVTDSSDLHECCTVPFPAITYTLHLKRRSTFYVVNIVFPSFLAYILISVGFYMPSDSGERMSLCVISILSQFVFLTVVADFMPPTAEFVPHLQRYFFTTIGMAVVSAFVTAWTLNMHFRSPVCEEVPKWKKILAFRILAPMACTKIRVRKYRRLKNDKTVKTNEDIPMNMYNGIKRSHLRLEGCEQHNTQEVDARMPACTEEGLLGTDLDTDPETQRRRLHDWREVARIFDRAYFVLYTLMQICLVIGFLTYIAKQGEGFHHEEEENMVV